MNNNDTNEKHSNAQWMTRHNKTSDALVVMTNQKMAEEKKKKEQGMEYSTTGILLLSKVWIFASL